jgi:hypothetical protein
LKTSSRKEKWSGDPDLQLALTRAAVLSLVETAGGRDVWMSEPAGDLGGGVPAALIATGPGELVLDRVAAWAAGRARGEPAACGQRP